MGQLGLTVCNVLSFFSTKQRIPVLKPKSAVDKQTNKPKLVQSHDENFKKPRLPHATPLRKTASTKPSRDSNTSIVHEATPKVMKRNSPTKPLESAKKPAQKAQDILADKVLFFCFRHYHESFL